MLETGNASIADPLGPPSTAETETPVSHKEKFIGQIVEHQLSDGRNHDVYEPRLTAEPPVDGFDYVPRCIYFYYVRIDGDGMVRIAPYFYADGPLDRSDEWQPIPYSAVADPEGIVKRLALNARPSTAVKDPPKLAAESFDEVKWNRRSYIVIFFDEANWSFHRRVGNKPSVAFNVSEGHSPNRSFFDAKDLMIEMPRRDGGSDNRSAIFFINHMKDADTGAEFAAGETEQHYKFDMYLRAKYAGSSTSTVTVIFDPTGTNQGPPETP